MATGYPPNRHPPLLEVTPTDHSAWVAISTALGLCCALVTLLLRAFVRAVISPPFGHDDTAIMAATLFAAIQSSILLHGVSKGLGKSVDQISPLDLLAVEKLLRWEIVVALDVITEILIFGMSFYLIYGLHMATKNKVIVLGAFGFRLVVIPFLIIRLVSFPRHHLSTDPAFTITYFYVWTQTTLYISLMVTTVPCLKPFVAGLNTGYGAFDTEHVATRAYGSYGSNGYAPRRKRTKHSSHMPSQSAIDLDPELDDRGYKRGRQQPQITFDNGAALARPEQVANSMGNVRVGGQDGEKGEGKATNHAQVVAQDGNSIGSNDSRQMIIRKDVAWAVEYSRP
ncbi:MAG: hypothetical protein Q9170_006561 [Blastenia crenularia]